MNTEQINLPDIADGEDKSSPFANRMRKNYRHVKKWAKKTKTDCFRIYDRDIREFPIAIDYYAGRFCVHYFSKGSDNEDPSYELKQTVEDAIKIVFGSFPHEIYWRTRSKTKETRQYEKIGESKDFFVVQEYGTKFLVNLTDYLDTGLFLDHRETRQIVSSFVTGKRLLNLFAYTCSFSVHAAIKGAAFTKSVDMSNTYCNWGKENFILNNLPLNNNLIVREDCLKFLSEETLTKNKYDVIVIDPPTISRSKKMDQLFDVNEDYIFLISKALELLTKEGIIFFSTNSRKFKMDESLFSNCIFKEITHKTIPIDFQNSSIHRCWQISKQ